MRHHYLATRNGFEKFLRDGNYRIPPCVCAWGNGLHAPECPHDSATSDAWEDYIELLFDKFPPAK